MTQLLAQFDEIFDTPGSVDKLRGLILDMAVRGKLVPQDQNDEPASELLQRIKAEKERLVKGGKIKRQKPLPAITKDETFFSIPQGWELERLGNVTQINPRNHLDDDVEVGFVPMKLIQDGFANKHSSEKRMWSGIKSGFTHFKDNDVVIAKITPCFENRKSAVIKDLPSGYGAGTTELYVVRGYGIHILPEYLLTLFKTGSFISDGVKTYSGTAGQQRVKKDYLVLLPILIPPLKEQERIIAKVNQLMQFCDQLQVRLEQKQKNEEKLHSSIFSSLEQAKTEEELQQHLEDALSNFHLLCNDTKYIKQLRNVILSLAVRGELVPQDPNDAPASELLESIKAEKERLVQEKKIKKEGALSEVLEEEMQYRLPNKWKYVRLGEIIHLISGQHLKPDQYNLNADGVAYLTGPSDFKDGKSHITRWTRLPKVTVEKNDILITVKGSGVGKSIILDVSSASIGRQLMAIRPLLSEVMYVSIFLELYRKEINEASLGIAIPGISREDLLELVFPLPPIDEQKRIVNKVNQLMQLCDQLEQRMEQIKQDKQRLMHTVLQTILQEDEAVMVAV